jgi:nitrate/nitrite transporter NarK
VSIGLWGPANLITDAPRVKFGWLFVTWMPSLLQKNYGLDLKKSSFFYAAMLFCAMIAELLGGVVTDYLLRRARSLQIARSLLIAVSWALSWRG